MTIPENVRFIAGVLSLLTVNIVWVLSSELINYFFQTQNYDKPFLVMYLRSSMFSFLLFGFVCSTHWKMLACPQKYYSSSCYHIQNAENNNERPVDIEILGEPTYIPIYYESDEENRLNHDNDYIVVNHREVEDDEHSNETCKRSVKFNRYKEVRHLSETYAEESSIARMSYNASRLFHKEIMIQNIIDQGLFPAIQVMKIAIQFYFFWFLANYAHQKGLSTTLPKVSNAVISTSSLLTLVLAALFPSSSKDKFSITKLLIVLLSLAGVVLVSFADSLDDSKFHYEGIIWSVVSAISYAVYLVNLRRIVKNRDQISIPMFLGFVGLWSIITLWPGFFIFNWTDYEKFKIPTLLQMGSILVNGLLGTVIAELLWLWGCFVTSSLTATVSLGLSIPLTMVADYFIYEKVYKWIFYLGSIPIIVSFLSVAYLSKGPGPCPDPLGHFLWRIFCTTSSTPKYERVSESDPDTDNDNSDHNCASGTLTKVNKGHINGEHTYPISPYGMFSGHNDGHENDINQMMINSS